MIVLVWVRHSFLFSSVVLIGIKMISEDLALRVWRFQGVSQTPELATRETFMNATVSRGHNCKQEKLIRDAFFPVSGLLPLIIGLYFSHLNSC